MAKNNTKIVFMGTPEFAVASLQALIENGYCIVGVVTTPDKPVGKHQTTLQYSPIKRYALSKNLPILQPEKLTNPVFIDRLTQLKADLQIVVAFRILPKLVWNMPHLGTFNLHASLLPQYRGAAPIHWAIINGEKETGVTTFFINHKIDSGEIIAQDRILIEEVDNAKTLHDKLMNLGAKLVIKTTNNLIYTKITPIVQIEPYKGIKYAPKIFTNTCQINWDQTVQKIYHFIRGLSPIPGAWAELAIQKKIIFMKIFEVEPSKRLTPILQTGNIILYKKSMDISAQDGWISIKTIQLRGKRRMSIQEFLVGNMHLFKNGTIENNRRNKFLP